MTESSAKPVLCVSLPCGERFIPFLPGLSVMEILTEADIKTGSSCGGTGACGHCLICIKEGEVNPPGTIELHLISSEKLSHGIRMACQVKPLQDLRITIEKSSEKSDWRSLSEEEYMPVVFDNTLPYLHGSHRYGIALDLGTTQIRLSFWDMKRRVRLAGRSGLNPQNFLGADILARLTYANESISHARKTGNIVRNAIGEALKDICRCKGFDLSKTGHTVIAGNTAMLALLSEKNYELLLQPQYWMSEIDCQPEDTGNWKTCWGINEHAKVEVIPPLAGFVGSDLLAGLLATQLTDGPAGSMLIDFGTNSEIALWDGTRLWITSAAGGPAFEGCSISCGIPAEDGAIYRISQEYSHDMFLCEVIGGVEARGLCGSAIVDITACLVRAGLLNRAGKFTPSIDKNGLAIVKGRNDLVIKKGDIDVFQRAKGAIGAAITYLLKKSGMVYKDLRRICVCGAFGRYLNIRNAQTVGLLPDIPSEYIELVGNAALAGCEILLFSRDRKGIIESLKSYATLLNLAVDPLFDELFIQNLYLQPMEMKGGTKC